MILPKAFITLALIVNFIIKYNGIFLFFRAIGILWIIFMLLLLIPFNLTVILETIFGACSQIKFLIFSQINLYIKCLMIILIFVSRIINIYNFYYIKYEKFLNRFSFTKLVFIFTILLLIASNSFYSVFMYWDILGLVSLFLIFYYNNNTAHINGLITFFCNRIGDSIIILRLAFITILSPSIRIINISYLFILAIITKRAQLPFSFWLPAAISAPTPIRSLVHSSTLVISGIFILCNVIQYSEDKSVEFVLKLIFFLRIYTYLSSRVDSISEIDLKKLIALSTLNQLSIMILFISRELWDVVIFYIISHALIKSLMFICRGVIIHERNSFQDYRQLNNFFNWWIKSIFSVRGFILQGAPLVTIYILKHEFLNNKLSSSIIILIFLFFILQTSAYVLRIQKILIVKSYQNIVNINSYIYIIFILIFIFIVSIIFEGYVIILLTNPFSLFWVQIFISILLIIYYNFIFVNWIIFKKIKFLLGNFMFFIAYLIINSYNYHLLYLEESIAIQW